MYMGVILVDGQVILHDECAPHVYGGDPKNKGKAHFNPVVLPMYMGVILVLFASSVLIFCAPHVYGGDPYKVTTSRTCYKVLPMYMGVIPSSQLA